MTTTNRYIFRQTLDRLVLATGVALVALLLERMLRIMDLTVGSEGSLAVMFGMLLNLVPHYLGLALPAAFYIGIWLAFARLNDDSELAALNAAGIGLHSLLMPVMGLAVALTLLTGAIFGYLQPHGRYAYRSLIYTVTHASLSAALEEGAFVQVGDLTFMAERVVGQGHELRRVFVHREREGINSITTTAKNGILSRSENDLRSVLRLSEGIRISRRVSGDAPDALTFTEYTWPIGEAGRAFRLRGNDQRELTLMELWSNRNAPPQDATPAQLRAEFHTRMVRTFSTLFLPFLAIPLALGRGYGRRSYGVVVGLLALIVYQKLLQFGESFSALGHISPYLGLWLPLLVFGGVSTVLFYRTGFGVGADPLGSLASVMDRLGERFRVIAGRVVGQK
jgi:lipopolysaccharide export system permease protein